MRLNQHDRNGIVKRAVDARFDGEDKSIADAKALLARRLYDLAFAKKTRDWAKAAPEGWVRLDECLRFNLCGMQITLKVDPGLPVPHNNGYCGTHRIAVYDEKFRDEYLALVDREKVLAEQRTVARESLAAVLARVNTLAQLKEAWPEGAKFYDDLSPRERIAVPALQVADLNKMLGLAAA